MGPEVGLRTARRRGWGLRVPNFFEVLVLVLAVELWGLSGHPTVILGDNVAALQLALDLKGKDGQASLAQALAVLVVSCTLHLTVGHLPSEANEAADTLSRQAEPGNIKPWPFGPEVACDTPLPVAVLLGWIS